MHWSYNWCYQELPLLKVLNAKWTRLVLCHYCRWCKALHFKKWAQGRLDHKPLFEKEAGAPPEVVQVRSLDRARVSDKNQVQLKNCAQSWTVVCTGLQTNGRTSSTNVHDRSGRPFLSALKQSQYTWSYLAGNAELLKNWSSSSLTAAWLGECCVSGTNDLHLSMSGMWREIHWITNGAGDRFLATSSTTWAGKNKEKCEGSWMHYLLMLLNHDVTRTISIPSWMRC